MHFVFAFLVVAASLGSIVTTIQVALTWLFQKGRLPMRHQEMRELPAGFQQADSFRPLPFVSILKPVCGLDDELEENLASFASLEGIRHEILLSVADPFDPAVEVIHRILERFPHAPFRLVTGGAPSLESGNRKVARLIAAAPYARGEVLLISDSNVRVLPSDVMRMMEPFRDPRVGCVSSLFAGCRSRTLGASIEALHLLSFVVPGAVTAAAVAVPCVVGKSMAVSRTALEAIGGFERFAGLLAEDQAMGLAVRGAGFGVVLSPVVVRNVIVSRTLARALDRQIRWNKIRYAFSRTAYAAEILVNPLPLMLLASITGVVAGVQPGVMMLPLLICILRMAQVAILAMATGVTLTTADLLRVPLLDLLMFGGQFVPFMSDRVNWRGHELRIGPQTMLMTEERLPLVA